VEVNCKTRSFIEIGRACSTDGEKRNAYRILMGKLQEKRPLGKHRRRWEDNIKMDLSEREWGGGWTGLIWLCIGTFGFHKMLGNS
jgi:hypothetical protein